jgi:N-acetylglucosamine kinase-like BadF-type ATPase
VVAGLGGRKHIAEALRGIGPARLGSLAPLVLSAAAEGDKQAVRIRTRAIGHVAALARVVDPGPDQPLYLAGGLSTNYRPDLVNCLGRPVSVPAADAMTGCYLVAAGRAPTERIVDKALA